MRYYGAKQKGGKLLKEKKKDCWSCGYKENCPGSFHISCTRTWEDIKPPKAKIVKGGRWYRFPMNFDPIWQEEECKGWAKEIDPEKKRVFSAVEQIFGILERRSR